MQGPTELGRVWLMAGSIADWINALVHDDTACRSILIIPSSLVPNVVAVVAAPVWNESDV